MPNDEIAFLLNDRDVQTSVPPGMLVLDFLRLDRRLTGTKEGCREGDCGACAVLVGELDGDAVRYKPVTSCLMPVGELHGKHLVSIEGLNTAALSPVQEAIVEEGATQCGFCTPGIVVSLTGFLIGEGEIDLEGVKYALGGHLCRCTGYRSLKNGRGHLERALGRRAAVDALVDRGGLPDYFREVPGRLRRIPSNTPRALNGGWTAAVAGGTDLYVQQGDAVERQSGLAVLNRHASLQGIDRDGDELRIGALTTFEDFADHVEVRGLIPQIRDYMHLIASWQIRNRATLGGNIINASPIGDLTVLLLALRAKLVLHGGDRPRQLPIEEFYQGYKKTDLGTGEVLTRIHLDSRPGRLVHFEKVSKRKCLETFSK